MFEKIKAEGGLTRYCIKKVYFGEQLKEQLAICDRMDLERQKSREDRIAKRANRESLVKKIQVKNKSRKAKKEEDEYLDSLQVAGQWLKSIDGINREVYDIDGKNYLVKIAKRDDIRDQNLQPYKKNLSKKDIIRKDFVQHPLYIKFNENYTRVISAKRFDEKELLLDCSSVDKNVHDYIILRF